MENLIGKLIHEYRLTQLLGHGGYGAVYLAKDEQKGTEVAIKVFLDISPDERNHDTFWRETRSIDQLSRQNPHIIKLLSFGKTELVDIGEVYFLIMPYYARGSLNKLSLPIEVPLAIQYIEDVADGLKHLHNQKSPIFHLDVTLANILLSDDGTAILSDFSMASLTQGITSRNTLGVPAFMAPERYRGESSSAVDQYALAVVCYKLLTGVFPFPGPGADDYEEQHSNDLPPSLCEKNPAVTKEIEAVLFKALAKNPLDRYGSVEEFAAQLYNASLPIDQRLTPMLPLVAESAVSNEAVLSPNQRVEVVMPLLSATPPFRRDRASRRRSPYPSDQISRRQFFKHGAIAVGTIILIGGGAVELARLAQSTRNIAPPPVKPQTPQVTQISYKFGNTIHVEPHNSQVTFAVLSPDGNRVASGGNSKGLRIWDATTGYRTHTSSYSDVVNDGVWDPRLQPMHVSSTEGFAVSADRMAIAIRDAYVYVIDPATGQRDPLPNDPLPFSAMKLAWARDGLHIACAVPTSSHEVGGIYIADDPDNCVAGCVDGVPYTGHNSEKGNVRAVAFSPNCQFLASGGDGKTIHLWRRDNQQAVAAPLAQPNGDTILALAFSPDGKRLVAGSANNTACVWNIENLKKPFIETVYRGHDDDVNAVAWSHNGKVIASASSDKSVHVWYPDSPNGTFYDAYQQHTSPAHTVAWSPNDDFIVSSEDHAVHVWGAQM